MPQIPLTPNKDRKLVTVGLTRLLTQCPLMFAEPSVHQWPPAFAALSELIMQPTKGVEDDEFSTATNPEDITVIDWEEAGAGYSAAFSRLAAAETGGADPVGWVRNPQEYLGQELQKAVKADGRVKGLILADPSSLGFLQILEAAGYPL